MLVKIGMVSRNKQEAIMQAKMDMCLPYLHSLCSDDLHGPFLYVKDLASRVGKC